MRDHDPVRTRNMRRFLNVATVLGLAVATAGCLGARSYTPTMDYVVEPAVDVSVADATTKTLGVRPLTPARPYTKPAMHYREEGQVLGRYDYDEWAELPGVVVTRALMSALVATGRFADVGPAIDVAAPDLILTGQLLRFDEVRTSAPAVALCEIRIEVRNTKDRSVVWADTVSASAPLEEEGPSALAKAMSKAVGQAISRAVAEIASRP